MTKDAHQPSHAELRVRERVQSTKIDYLLALRAMKPYADKQEVQKIDQILSAVGLI